MNNSYSPMPISAIVFDMDGTLLDTLPDIARSFNTVFARLGFSEYPADVYKQFVGRGLKNAVKASLPRSEEFSPEELDHVLGQILEEYHRDPAGMTVPYPGIPELLADLAAAGIPLAVLSNKDHSLTLPIIRITLPGIPFAAVQGKTDRYPLKPEPESVLALVRELGTEPADTLFIGDSIVDFQTALNAGMIPAVAGWGFSTPEALRASGCSPLYETVAELRAFLLG